MLWKILTQGFVFKGFHYLVGLTDEPGLNIGLKRVYDLFKRSSDLIRPFMS